MQCPLCRVRPVRRVCPALGRDICPVCCGTKRLVEIRCPDTCAYLSSARSHPPAAVRRQEERDTALVAPGVAGLSADQQQLFALCLTLVDRFRGSGLDAAVDLDVADAAEAMAATYETEARGLIYEHRAGSAPAQRVVAGMRGVFGELGRRHPTAFASDLSVVLRRLAKRVREARPAAGDDPTAFIDAAGRIARRLVAGSPGESPGAERHPGEDPGSVIVRP